MIHPRCMDLPYHSYVQQATLFPSTFEYLFVITDSACDGIDIDGEHHGPPYDVILTINGGPNETPRPLFNYTISGYFGCYASILFECDQSPSDGNCDHWHVTDSDFVLHPTHTYPYGFRFPDDEDSDDEEDSHEEDWDDDDSDDEEDSHEEDSDDEEDSDNEEDSHEEDWDDDDEEDSHEEDWDDEEDSHGH